MIQVHSHVPQKLNRYYEFTVSVRDGDVVARRTFRIFVVGDDFLRADNTICLFALEHLLRTILLLELQFGLHLLI